MIKITKNFDKLSGKRQIDISGNELILEQLKLMNETLKKINWNLEQINNK